MHEHWPYHPIGGDGADERPARARPLMNDRDLSSVLCRMELPYHHHSRGNPTNVSVVHRWRTSVNRHLGYPPRGVPEDAERTPCSHLDYPTMLTVLEHPHPSVVAQYCRPLFDVHRRAKHTVHWSPHQNPVNGAHQ